MRSCATCENYEIHDNTCRALPPLIIKRIENNFPGDGGGSPGRWPVVKPDEWCAHHKPIPPIPPVTGVEVISVEVVR